MKKKKVMKAIAAAGVAIGGASVLQDGNMVYAAEYDQGLVGDELILPAEEEEISEEQTIQDSNSGSEATEIGRAHV